MLSDKVISLVGHSFTIHYFGLYLTAAIFLFALVFFLWGYLRGKRLAGARSIRRDELAIYLGRIADSLEALQRAASRISSNVVAEPTRTEIPTTDFSRQQDDAQRENAPPAAKPVKAMHSVAYSLFGR